MPASRAAVELRYARLRSAAHAQAELLFAPVIAPTPVRFATISHTALDAWAAQWADHSNRRVLWPWPDLVKDLRRRSPARFELALWSGDDLCGLAIGRTATVWCSIDYIEGSPKPAHALRQQVIPSAITALQAYATVLGKSELRLVDPIGQLMPFYAQRGFSLVERRGARPYLSRRTS